MLYLQQIEGRTYNPSLQPEKVVLKPTVTRFGRSEEHSDVVIDSSVSPLMISRVHAEIHFDKGKFRIDCKGLNGLLVNKTKRSSAVLCDGDEIVFGGAGGKTKEGPEQAHQFHPRLFVLRLKIKSSVRDIRETEMLLLWGQ